MAAIRPAKMTIQLFIQFSLDLLDTVASVLDPIPAPL